MALTPKYLQECTDGIEKQYSQLVTEILEDIAERIKIAGSMTSTTEYLNAKAQELGLQQEFINKKLAEITKTSEADIEKLMNESTYKSVRSSLDLLKNNGYDFTGMDFKDKIEQATNVAKGELTNLTRTTGQLGTTTFMNAYDQAYLQVASGAYSLDEACTNVIKKLANEGIGQIEYPTGAKRSVEAAVRVAVRTSVAQNALACEKQIIDETGVNLVEVSSHLGARPSHAVWQGKVFWVNEPEGNYENFYEATGYGTPTGLGGYNCRHQFYPYIEGIDRAYEHIDETKNAEYYEMEQKQRAYERKLRAWDSKKKILEAGGQDSTEAARWKNYYKQKINELVKKSNRFLKHDYSAERSYVKSNKVIRISQKIDISNVNLNVNPEKQSKHIQNGRLFQEHLQNTGKRYSYLVLNEEEIDNFVKKTQEKV